MRAKQVNCVSRVVTSENDFSSRHERSVSPFPTAEFFSSPSFMVADPTGERARGVPKLEWIDATDGTSFNDLQAAMMTHSQEMRLKLARGDVPLGYMSFGAQTAKAFEDADAEATIAEEKQQSAARQQSGESASGGGGGSADDGIPEDIKEWAARIAAEAREGRTA